MCNLYDISPFPVTGLVLEVCIGADGAPLSRGDDH